MAFCNHGIKKCVPSLTTSSFTPANLSKMTALLPPLTSYIEAWAKETPTARGMASLYRVLSACAILKYYSDRSWEVVVERVQYVFGAILLRLIVLALLVTISMGRASPCWVAAWRSQDLERSSIREPMTKLLQATPTHQSLCAQLKLFSAAAALRSESTEGKHWPLFPSIQDKRGVVALGGSGLTSSPALTCTFDTPWLR
jgi:hypothetical protein